MARLIATLTLDRLADEVVEDALTCPLCGDASTATMRVLLIVTDQGERILTCDQHTVTSGFIVSKEAPRD